MRPGVGNARVFPSPLVIGAIPNLAPGERRLETRFQRADAPNRGENTYRTVPDINHVPGKHQR